MILVRFGANEKQFEFLPGMNISELIQNVSRVYSLPDDVVVMDSAQRQMDHNAPVMDNGLYEFGKAAGAKGCGAVIRGSFVPNLSLAA